MTAFKGLGTYGNAVGVVTPLDHKLSNAAQVAKSGNLTIRPGLFWGGVSNIVTGTAGMSYSVAAYDCVTQRSAAAGAVFGGNDGAVSVATTAAPGANSRYDVVYHWHREYSLDGVDSNPVIGVVQGTAAASPTVPSLAAFPGAIALATILVPTGVTATNSGTTITQSFPITAMDGGVPTVPDPAARGRSFPSPAQGDRVNRLDRPGQDTYLALYNSGSNPYGANPASWYPVDRDINTKLAVAANVALSGLTTVSWASASPLYPGTWAIGQPTRLVLPFVGVWEISYIAVGTGIAAISGIVQTNAYLNGSLISDSSDVRTSQSGIYEPQNKSTFVLTTTAGSDYVELKAQLIAGSGGSPALLAAGTRMWAKYLGPARF